MPANINTCLPDTSDLKTLFAALSDWCDKYQLLQTLRAGFKPGTTKAFTELKEAERVLAAAVAKVRGDGETE